MSAGRLYGIGLGPGDPELMTVKALRCLQAAPVVAYFCKDGRRGHARTIVEGLIAAETEELALAYPVTTEIPVEDPAYNETLARFYAEATEALADRLAAGRDVALICEGDPLFYGSFMHLYVRLQERFAVTIIPGVTGMSGCWTAAMLPMSWGDDVLAVLPGTLPAEVLAEKLAASDAVVVMKLGRHLAKVRAAIAAAGRLGEAIYVERGTMDGERILPLADKLDDRAPYFAMILIPGRGRRPR